MLKIEVLRGDEVLKCDLINTLKYLHGEIFSTPLKSHLMML